MATTITQTGMAIPGHHVTFGLTTDIPGAYKFHWMKDGILIGGAPSAKSYTTPPLQESDMKAKFSVKVYGYADQETSNELTLVVAPESVAVKKEKK